MKDKKSPSISPRMNSARGTLAAMSIHHAPDSEHVLTARRDLRAIKLEEYVTKAVAEFPPLTDEQLKTVARLLLPSIVASSNRGAE